MKKLLLLAISFCILCVNKIQVHQAESMQVESQAAILMDGKTGQVLYSKNADQRLYPASITKVLTGYLLLEKKGNLDGSMVVSANAVDSIDRDSSHIALDYNEEVLVKDLMYAMLLQSANDASNVIAEYVSGSQEAFVGEMNAQVEKWGLKNTHFTNAHGLQDENHYTSAYDMAIILKHALTNETFKEVIGTNTYTGSPTNKLHEERLFANGNKMIKKGKYYYEYVKGGKTGYTEFADYTFAVTASKDTTDLIVVLLGSPSEEARYQDTLALFEYGFQHFKGVTLKAEEFKDEQFDIIEKNRVSASVSFHVPSDVDLLVNVNADLSTLELKNHIEHQNNVELMKGYVDILLDGVLIKSVDMEKEVTIIEDRFDKTWFGKVVKGLHYFSVVILCLALFLTGLKVMYRMKS